VKTCSPPSPTPPSTTCSTPHCHRRSGWRRPRPRGAQRAHLGLGGPAGRTGTASTRRDGRLRSPGSRTPGTDAIAAVSINRNANKIDSFLVRTIEYRPTVNQRDRQATRDPHRVAHQHRTDLRLRGLRDRQPGRPTRRQQPDDPRHLDPAQRRSPPRSTARRSRRTRSPNSATTCTPRCWRSHPARPSKWWLELEGNLGARRLRARVPPAAAAHARHAGGRRPNLRRRPDLRTRRRRSNAAAS
jgi:hypothetical protein